jgi:hypothetical protein
MDACMQVLNLGFEFEWAYYTDKQRDSKENV